MRRVYMRLSFTALLLCFGLSIAACSSQSPKPSSKASVAMASANSRAPYTPPVSSAPALVGVDWSGAPVGASYVANYAECDAHDTCEGAAIRYQCHTDPNRNTTLLRLRKGTVFFDAKLALDADGSPYAVAHAGSINQPDTSLRYPLPGNPSINADRVPFIVIPLGIFAKDLGIQLGDVAAVVSGDQRVYAVIADEGPKCKIGEGSIALHEALDHRVCRERNAQGDCIKLTDSSIERDVLFFIFPRTREKLYPGLNPDNINQRLQLLGAQAWRIFTMP